MSKQKKRLLLRINAVIVSLLGLMGCRSCSYYVKYGVPDYPFSDTPYVDTTMYAMYGVMPVVKYGVPGGEWAPAREPQQEPETEDAKNNK